MFVFVEVEDGFVGRFARSLFLCAWEVTGANVSEVCLSQFLGQWAYVFDVYFAVGMSGVGPVKSQWSPR
jgi:hypothetical protein